MIQHQQSPPHQQCLSRRTLPFLCADEAAIAGLLDAEPHHMSKKNYLRRCRDRYVDVTAAGKGSTFAPGLFAVKDRRSLFALNFQKYIRATARTSAAPSVNLDMAFRLTHHCSPLLAIAEPLTHHCSTGRSCLGITTAFYSIVTPSLWAFMGETPSSLMGNEWLNPWWVPFPTTVVAFGYFENLKRHGVSSNACRVAWNYCKTGLTGFRSQIRDIIREYSTSLLFLLNSYARMDKATCIIPRSILVYLYNKKVPRRKVAWTYGSQGTTKP
ncbi:hypothetical protein JHK87_043232 [Glycine soja]|nr:hypothetical protein JHK87_043232 [Glycine soja]